LGKSNLFGEEVRSHGQALRCSRCLADGAGRVLPPAAEATKPAAGNSEACELALGDGDYVLSADEIQDRSYADMQYAPHGVR
jgi:hypothetical protein